jgi:hypothetical protein
MLRNNPLKNKAGLRRIKPISRRSKKTDALYREFRTPFVIDFLQRHPQCSFKLWIMTVDTEELPPPRTKMLGVTFCSKPAEDVHEILSRARGGNIVPIDGQDELEQFAGLCRGHHTWVTSHPKESKKLGYSR